MFKLTKNQEGNIIILLSILIGLVLVIYLFNNNLFNINALNIYQTENFDNRTFKCPDKIVTYDNVNYYFSTNNKVDTTRPFISSEEAHYYLKRKNCNSKLNVELIKNNRPSIVKSSNDPSVSYDRQCYKEVAEGGYKNKICMIDKLAKDTNTDYNTLYSSIFQGNKDIIFPLLNNYIEKEPITDLMTDKIFSL